MGDIFIDIKEIMQRLPHRHPFILVDRILNYEKGKKITGLKNVTINEPFFPGHFPGNPIMPGVLILEAMGQTGGIMVYLEASQDKQDLPIFFTGLDKVRFRKPVVPGDQIIMELSILRKRKNMMKMKGTAMVDGKLAAEAELMAAWGTK